MNESNERKNGTILSFVSIFISTFLQLFYTPLLLRKLGGSEYGLYSIGASIISYLVILDFGFGDAIVMYTSKYNATGDKENEKKLQGMFLRIFTYIGIISFIIGCIISFLSPIIFGNSMNEIEVNKIRILILILSFNLAITFPFNVYSSIIKAYERFTFQKSLNIVHSIIQPLLMLPLLFLGFKSIALTIVITLTNLIVIISNYYYCKKKLKINVKYRGFDKKTFKVIFGFSFYIFLNMVVDRVNWSVDQTILGIISGTLAVSSYALATKINDVFIKLSTALSGILFPKISKMVAKKSSDEELTNEFVKTGRLQYFLIFLITSGFVIFGKEFFNFWVGPKYRSAYYVTLLLIIPISIPLIQNLGISILRAKNIHKFRSIVYMFVAIFNIIISIPLTKAYNEIGAAMGTAISLIIGNVIIINIYYHTKAGLNIVRFWKEILKITLWSIIPLTIIIIIKSYISINIISFILLIAFYSILYFLISYYLSMNNYEKEIIKNVIRKIKKRRS